MKRSRLDIERLQWMQRCQEHAAREHDEPTVRAAARAIGRENHLPEPEQLDLLPAE